MEAHHEGVQAAAVAAGAGVAEKPSVASAEAAGQKPLIELNDNFAIKTITTTPALEDAATCCNSGSHSGRLTSQFVSLRLFVLCGIYSG
jgi:hypothetical protein